VDRLLARDVERRRGSRGLSGSHRRPASAKLALARCGGRRRVRCDRRRARACRLLRRLPGGARSAGSVAMARRRRDGRGRFVRRAPAISDLESHALAASRAAPSPTPTSPCHRAAARPGPRRRRLP
jgi:hypothetical protein